MVNWKEPEVQIVLLFLLDKMFLFTIGAYSWYMIQTWPVIEGALVTRRLKISYAHVPYLVARYSQFITLLLSTIMSHWPAPVASSCKKLNFTRASVIIGNLALVASSSNLGVRALALWRGNVLVRMVLIIIIVGHIIFAILMGTIAVKGQWSNHHTVCVLINEVAQRALTGYYSYTLAVDFTILTFTLLGLRRQSLASNSPLWAAITKQGVGYAAATVLTMLPLAVTVSLDLNEVANIFLAIPGLTVIVISSSAAVLSLIKMKAVDSYVEGTGLESPNPEEKMDGRSGNQFTTNIDLADFRDSGELSRENVMLPEKLVAGPSSSAVDLEYGDYDE